MKRRGILTCLSVTVLAICLSAALMNSSLSAQSRKGSRLHPPIVGPADIDGFSSPIRIAFGPAGTLLVTDYNLEMVAYVDPQTNVIKGGFPVDGRPLGVVYARKRIFVGNETKACVSVFSEEGTWLKDITGGALGPITKPTDLAVDLSSNQLFVLDFGVRAVRKFSLNGTEWGTVPPVLPDPAALTMPAAIAVDPLNFELLVSDYGGMAPDGTAIKPRIQVFDYNGNLNGTISSYLGGMMGGYKFSRPQGLQVDAQGQVILTDSFSGEVLIINRSTGTVIKTLGGYGVEPGKMRLPLDLVMDEVSKDIFVTNNLLKRIEVFRLGGIY